MTSDGSSPTIYRHDYTPPPWLVDHIALEFDLDAERTRVSARLRLRANPQRDGAAELPVRLNGEALALRAIAIDGVPLEADAYRLSDVDLTFDAPGPAFELALVTEIAPARNTRLEGLYMSQSAYCTQCEAEGFRRITYFPDRPDVMATYRVTLRAADCPVLLSNGNLVAQGPLEDGRRYAVWDDPFPKPSYLFALVAGDLACVEDSFTTASGRKVALRIYVEPGNEGRCAYAMDALKRAMAWDERVYGLQYDLDLFNIVAVSDFNMGAMENKSLNIFNAKYILADPQTATDADYAFIEAVVAHEYFHNWTGNRITCRDWFQLSLKEGLTVFRDQEFSADARSRPVKRITDVRALRARQFPEDSGPLAHPVRPDSYIEINNFYTATVYEKGAELIRMMHNLLGAEGYRAGIDLYIRRHDGQAVTCDDFVAAMEDATGVDLGQFRRWYAQAGTPRLSFSGAYDPAARRFVLIVNQTTPPTPGQPDKQPLHIPLSVGLLAEDGRELAARQLEVTEARQSFVFEDIDSAPEISFNRGFAAPVIVTTAPTPATLRLLMAHDSDPFSRWEAAQSYAVTHMRAQIERVQAGETVVADMDFIAAIDRLAADEALDPAFRAEALILPGEAYLADQMKVVDVEAIHTVRETLRRAVATALQSRFEALYHRYLTNEPFSPDAAAAGRRALKNTALSYLVALETDEGDGCAVAQFDTADNMTDRMAALALLSNRPVAARAQVLAAFHDRYAGDAVVMDKWLAVQAMSSLPDTLERVRALLAHPVFSMTNPNKVRSLIGAFAVNNQLRFHAQDGSGYRFLADRLLELDAINPQTAARIATPLGRWRRFDAGRAEKMKAALTRILDKPDLSPDLYEIASKSLTA